VNFSQYLIEITSRIGGAGTSLPLTQISKKAANDYKPDSVPACAGDDHSSKQPKPGIYAPCGARHEQRLVPYLALHRKGFALHMASQPCTVVSYTAFSPLPLPGRFVFCGTVLTAGLPRSTRLFNRASRSVVSGLSSPKRSSRPSSVAGFNLMPASKNSTHYPAIDSSIDEIW